MNFPRHVQLYYQLLRFSIRNGRRTIAAKQVIKMCPCSKCALGWFDILVAECSFINNKGRQFHFPEANRNGNVSWRHFGDVHLVSRRDNRSVVREHRLNCVTLHQQEFKQLWVFVMVWMPKQRHHVSVRFRSINHRIAAIACISTVDQRWTLNLR